MKVTIATSIAPRGIETQQRAINSWLAYGFDVISLNIAEEIGELEPQFPGVKFVPVTETGLEVLGRPVPKIYDAVRALAETSSDVVGLVNSDISFRGGSKLRESIHEAALSGGIFAARVDLPHPDDTEGETLYWGFDCFFFDRKHASAIEDRPFWFGVPWWDLWVPMSLAIAGVHLRRISTKFAFHVIHETKWNQSHHRAVHSSYEKFLRDHLEDHIRELGFDPFGESAGHSHGAYKVMYSREEYALKDGPRLPTLPKTPAPPRDPLPLIALVMILKDEARSIEKVIRSAAPAIDHCVILDTGSTDETKEIAQRTCEELGLTLDLHEEPFVDYSTTRNRALAIARKQSVFSLQMSGDEFLGEPDALRAFCESIKNDMHGAYYVDVRYDTLSTNSTRLARNSGGWRWVRRVHEYMTGTGTIGPRVPSSFVLHTNADPVQKMSRFPLMLQLLQADLRDFPDDARTMFYIAQTLEDLGRHNEAYHMYKKRIATPGWVEETFESMCRLAKSGERIKVPWNDVQQLYLDAHAYRPHRAEPLWEIAIHWYYARNHALTYLFAHRGWSLPYPSQDSLFIQRSIYDWQLAELVSSSAFYLGEIEIGRKATLDALAKCPPEHRERIRGNLQFYGGETTQQASATVRSGTTNPAGEATA